MFKCKMPWVIFSQEIEHAKARVQESLHHRSKPRGASVESMRAFYGEKMAEEARLSMDLVDAEAGLAKAQFVKRDFFHRLFFFRLVVVAGWKPVCMFVGKV